MIKRTVVSITVVVGFLTILFLLPTSSFGSPKQNPANKKNKIQKALKKSRAELIEKVKSGKKVRVWVKEKNRKKVNGRWQNKVKDIQTEQELSELESDENVVELMEDPVLQQELSASAPYVGAASARLYEIDGQAMDGTGQTVCIVDGGIAYTNPDLGGCFGPGCKVVDGYNYVTNNDQVTNGNSHGTHVAGIVAADGKYKGMAPKAKLISQQVCTDGGSCYGSKMSLATEWCAENAEEYNIVAINISIGDSRSYTESTCPTWMDNALKKAYDKGITITVASGNQSYRNGVSYPACSPYVTAVGATGRTNDNIRSSSNRGYGLDLYAPGSSIISTCGTSYCTKSGTSMAAPHVAGAAALISQYYKDAGHPIKNTEIEELLQRTGKVLSGDISRIDVLKAFDEKQWYLDTDCFSCNEATGELSKQTIKGTECPEDWVDSEPECLAPPVVTITPISTNNRTPELIGTVNDIMATILIVVERDAFTATNNGDNTWVLTENTVNSLPDGIYDVTAIAISIKGKKGIDSNKLIIDATAPDVSFNSVISCIASPELTGRIDDRTAEVVVTVNEEKYIAAISDDGNWKIEAGLLGPLNQSIYDVLVTATDSLGNTGIANGKATLTIEWNDAPAFTTVSSSLDSNVLEDSLWSEALTATDIDGDKLIFRLQQGSSGLLLDSISGIMTWCPGNNDVGLHSFMIEVTDGELFDSLSFSLIVENTNDAPVFESEISSLMRNIDERSIYSDTVHASDCDTDTLYFTLLSGPDGMTVTLLTGIISWNTSNESIGEHDIVIEVSDRQLCDTIKYSIQVENKNDPPVIISKPEALTNSVNEDIHYIDTVFAMDIDANTQLSYNLVNAPDSMKIGIDNGILSWLPENDDVGLHDVTVRVSDGELEDTLKFRITVVNINDSPVINKAIPQNDTTIMEMDSLLFTINAADIDMGDMLTHAWLYNGDTVKTVTGSSSSFLCKTDYKSAGVDSITVLVFDGIVTIQHKWALKVKNVPLPPKIILPGNGKHLFKKNSLCWRPSIDPDLGKGIFYKIQLSLDSLFNKIALIRDSLKITQIIIDSLDDTRLLPHDKKLFWRVKALNNRGYETGYSPETHYFIYKDQPVSLSEIIPFKDFVAQNSPNPFGEQTSIAFGVSDKTHQLVTISIYSLSGVLVETLGNKQYQPGNHTIIWDSKRHDRGTYIYQIKIGNRFQKSTVMFKLE
ncbi:MAG: S8 family serine peptidase [Fibrobacteria bacterium]|nr:S8 family serine peptidase [Fibrobacteria bacterium]